MNKKVNNELEKLQVIASKASKKYIMIGIIIFILSLMLSCWLSNPFITIGGFVIAICFYSMEISNLKREFKNSYKTKLFLQIFKQKFQDVTYFPDKGIDEDIIYDTGMMKEGDNYYSNDYIKAKYKDIEFETADVLIQDEYVDINGNVKYTPLFSGQWFIFNFNKPFKDDVQVCEKTFKNASVPFKNFHKVEIKDKEFNKIFNVYGQNDLETLNILTPKMIKRIKEINEKIEGDLLFCFINQKLHVGLYNYKDLFEVNYKKPIDFKNIEKQTLQEISYITDLIDILSLDKDLFKKRKK